MKPISSIEVNKKYKEEKRLASKLKKAVVSKKKDKSISREKHKVSPSLKSKVKKKKAKTRGMLVKELDAIYSKYIRLRDADTYGVCSCITCGIRKHRKEMQNGHRISRAVYKYRRDDRNCNAQCMGCNIFKSGNYIPYTLTMIDRLGRDVVEYMMEDNELIKITTNRIKDSIEKYTLLFNALLKEKSQFPQFSLDFNE